MVVPREDSGLDLCLEGQLWVQQAEMGVQALETEGAAWEKTWSWVFTSEASIVCQLSLLGPGDSMVLVPAVLEFSPKQEDKWNKLR